MNEFAASVRTYAIPQTVADPPMQINQVNANDNDRVLAILIVSSPQQPDVVEAPHRDEVEQVVPQQPELMQAVPIAPQQPEMEQAAPTFPHQLEMDWEPKPEAPICTVCRDYLERGIPKILSCGHLLCNDCVTGIYSMPGHTRCPICRRGLGCFRIVRDVFL